MYTAKKRCVRCHEYVIIEKPTMPEIHMAMARLKYCPVCRETVIKSQKYSSNKKRKPNAYDNVKFGTQSMWDTGFQKFWAKRGMKEPTGTFNPPYEDLATRV